MSDVPTTTAKSGSFTAKGPLPLGGIPQGLGPPSNMSVFLWEKPGALSSWPGEGPGHGFFKEDNVCGASLTGEGAAEAGGQERAFSQPVAFLKHLRAFLHLFFQ